MALITSILAHVIFGAARIDAVVDDIAEALALGFPVRGGCLHPGRRADVVINLLVFEPLVNVIFRGVGGRNLIDILVDFVEDSIVAEEELRVCVVAYLALSIKRTPHAEEFSMIERSVCQFAAIRSEEVVVVWQLALPRARVHALRCNVWEVDRLLDLGCGQFKDFFRHLPLHDASMHRLNSKPYCATLRCEWNCFSLTYLGHISLLGRIQTCLKDVYELQSRPIKGWIARTLA